MSDFLSMGFRPFYLGAAGFALASVPLWILSYTGTVALLPAVPPALWHAHEMIFGFATAVIIGFLLTAARNWTGLPTAAGARLGTLFGLWLAARLANWSATGMLPILLDGGFLLSATILLGIPIVKARNRRNYFVLALLSGLTLGAVLHGLAIRGALTGSTAITAPRAAMDLILLLMIVIGGRVIPAFSGNAIPGLKPKSWLPLEILAVASALCLLLIDLGGTAVDAYWWQFLCGGAALLHLARLAGWKPWQTVRNPLLLALPLAYLWIPIHLTLRAFESSTAIHALTVGAMTSLMLAMMTRSALGHTGRALVAGPAELICFAAIHLAAATRVFGPLLVPSGHVTWLWLAAVFWTLAFATFFAAYLPVLTRPRLGAQTST